MTRHVLILSLYVKTAPLDEEASHRQRESDLK